VASGSIWCRPAFSWPALNQTVCALRFFYGVTLRYAEMPERIPYARELRQLPIVLNAGEVVRFLEAVPSPKTRAALTTAYAAGLRPRRSASRSPISTAVGWSSGSSTAFPLKRPAEGSAVGRQSGR
jgi:hypothetical protein